MIGNDAIVDDEGSWSPFLGGKKGLKYHTKKATSQNDVKRRTDEISTAQKIKMYPTRDRMHHQMRSEGPGTVLNGFPGNKPAQTKSQLRAANNVACVSPYT
ncbi:EXPERA domain-containing protein [Psidium guajava]|nr:EXPERA domain-containing protein [Psidium guajava]